MDLKRGERIGFLVGAALLLAGLVVALLASASPAAAPASERPARVSIAPWEQGVVGTVTGGGADCREGRRVGVFRMRGKRPRPGADRRIASARTRGGSGPAIWYARTKAGGPLYAKTRRTDGCAPGLSKRIQSAGFSSGDDDDQGYPSCGPYVSEGVGTICKLERVTMVCGGPSFSRGSGSCDTAGANLWVNGGSYPWGLSGSGDVSAGALNWDHGNHSLTYNAFEWQTRDLRAYLRGTIPGPERAEFSVSDGWGRADSGPASGDHFFTPDLPDQRAGEPGGPLYFDFSSGTNRNNVSIRGYLYLKP